MKTSVAAFLLILAIRTCSSFFVSDLEWTNYKNTYGKIYDNKQIEFNKRSIFAVNKGLIDIFNSRYDPNFRSRSVLGNRVSYRLAVNQFSDMRFLDFAALYPPTQDISSNAVPYTPASVTPPASFSYANQGFTSPVQNQGKVCNSGWAYATATAVQIFSAAGTGDLTSVLLSAQNLIDCAGRSTACRAQVPQVAFDYLTQKQNPQKLYPESSYPNNPLMGQGMCVYPSVATNAKSLTSYSTIANGNDDILKVVVANTSPVVTKFNPCSFQFMHYKAGVFTQPRTTLNCAHYMTVIGYDTVGGKDYWLVQNSFGDTWGEAGLIRIERSATKPIANSAMFPSV